MFESLYGKVGKSVRATETTDSDTPTPMPVLRAGAMQDFLKPFEYIMNHSKRPEIRDLVVNCFAQMVQAQVFPCVIRLACGSLRGSTVRPS